MLMSGNMSVGVRMRTTGVKRITTSAITTNVYGLDKANRTIHISRNVTLNSKNAPRLCRHPDRLELEFGLLLLDYRRPSFRYIPRPAERGGAPLPIARIGVSSHRKFSWSHARKTMKRQRPALCLGHRVGRALVGLLANYKIHAHATNLDQVAVVQSHRAGNGRAIYNRDFGAGAQVIAVVALVNLRSHLRLEPTAKLHRRHRGFANDRELVGKHVLLLVHSAVQHDERRHFHAARRELRALTHGGGLPLHFAAHLGIENHGFIDFGRGGLAAPVPGNGTIGRSVHFDVVLAYPDGVAIVQRCALHAKIVDERAVQAVQIFDHKAAAFEVNAGVERATLHDG